MGEFVRFIKTVFNPVALSDNKRLIHLLSILANSLLKLDIPNIDVLEIHKAIRQTYFYSVFRIIFHAQKCNIKSIQTYIDFTIHEMIRQGVDVNENKALDVEELSLSLEENEKETPDKPKKSALELEEAANKNINEIKRTEERNAENENVKQEEFEKEFGLAYKYNLESKPTKAKQKALIQIMDRLCEFIADNMSASKQQTNRLEDKSFSKEVMWLIEKMRRKVDKNKVGRSEAEVIQISNNAASLAVCIFLG